MLAFIVLLIFAGALMSLQVKKYGSLMGFVYYNQDSGDLIEKTVDYAKIFTYSRFLIISAVSLLLAEYVYRFYRKMNKKEEKAFERRFIDINLKD